MRNRTTLRKTIKYTTFLGALGLIGISSLIYSCNKKSQQTAPVVATASNSAKSTAAEVTQGHSQTYTVTIANMRKSGDGTANEVMFNELAELFTVQDAGVLAALQNAFKANKMVTVSVDPWKASVLQVGAASNDQVAARSSQETTGGEGKAYKVDLSRTGPDVINNIAGSAILNTATTPGLTSVIPDMATAQLMFDYIAHQCCALPGPYTIDYCISFQYCEDGCYARAHKMCYILNNKYNYATHKVFSFANAGVDELCVKGEKWGGCCVNWWYHVAPLVNIKTPAGTKAYVFDPAMFDQPVLLATWLHAQENPACVPSGDMPHVSMINIQPTSSYEPSGSSGLSFNTDPMYTATDHTLTVYRPLITCP